ncbi:hypothetical protein HD597_000440 [Nonomuraea thailandensis]|uniref:Uncharacterized protein n=1 Tax=Nonomuraea thailandensis TaxID=1188745 RepID=A0A9X2G988_9ACTN|nr:hypothetical protein [Nonomuraea thailandensis]MCP2353420.1 hypothetical protein [Nonomuraea thailandensis]
MGELPLEKLDAREEFAPGPPEIVASQRSLSLLDMRLLTLLDGLKAEWTQRRPLSSAVIESSPQLVIVYLESKQDAVALERAKDAVRHLGGQIRESTQIVRGSVWQAFVAVFKREMKTELADRAGGYGAALNNKANAEALQIMQRSMRGAQTGLVQLGNLLALRVDGVPYGVELTPVQVRLIHSRPDLQRSPAEVHALLSEVAWPLWRSSMRRRPSRGRRARWAEPSGAAGCSARRPLQRRSTGAGPPENLRWVRGVGVLHDHGVVRDVRRE